MIICRLLYEDNFSFLQSKCLGVGLLVYMVNWKLFSPYYDWQDFKIGSRFPLSSIYALCNSLFLSVSRTCRCDVIPHYMAEGILTMQLKSLIS